MSLIQKLRDKYARWAAIAIGISLVGFVMMDAFSGRTGLFSDQGPGNTLGKVNGTSINYREFAKDMESLVQQYKQQGYEVNDEQREQLLGNMWDQKVTDVIMQDEFEKLGLEVTDKEIRNEFISNPPQQFKDRFTDDKGQFNAVEAQREINNILKDPKQKEGIRNYLLQKKYMVLFSNSVNYPKWYVEKKNMDASMMAKVSYVTVPFTTIDDKAVKLTDEEIQDYINKHKEDFEQKDESRTISYVSFNAAPTSADSAALRAELETTKQQFAADSNTALFVTNKQGEFSDIYLGANDIQSVAKDTIIKQPVGTVYGPYVEQDNYMLAKMVDIKSMADSIKCRHILIGTMNPQTGTPTTPDSIAKAKADSIELAIQNGASFDLLDSLHSTDEVAKKDKGVMTFSAAQMQSPNFAKEFADFVMNGKPGDKDVVKTQFGYHYIEILEHKNVSPHYKIAFIGKQIVASDETESNALNKATQFAGDSRDLKAFEDNYEKKLKSQGILKSSATLAPLDSRISGMQGTARSFIKEKIFEGDQGDVLSPERIGDQYIVAAITSINKPGLRTVAQVRPTIEPFLLNKKKGEQIIKNIGQITTLEQVSAKMGQAIQTVDSIRLENPRVLGYEPKVLGAAFNPANKNRVVPAAILGTQGVYVLRVDNLTTTPIESGSLEDQQRMLEAQNRNALNPQYGGGSPIINALKKASTIKDYRHKFY